MPHDAADRLAVLTAEIRRMLTGLIAKLMADG
jgi:hypothetical protein